MVSKVKTKIKVFSKCKDDVITDCKIWAREIEKTYSPDLIVFVSKSGFLFAKPIADYFNCEMLEVKACRPGEDKKNQIKKYIPRIPESVLRVVLSSKAMYGYNEENSDREVHIGANYKKVYSIPISRILIIDDSADTGWTLVEVKEEVKKLFPNSEIKIGCYCEIDYSKNRIKVDYSRYRNTIVLTATSRYSPEHSVFISELCEWRENSEKNQ